MHAYPILLLEGVFDSGGESPLTGDSLDQALLPFAGQRVRFAAHHLPASPIDPTRWGGGGCTWQASGFCPAGHHVRPTWLYNVTCEGVLDRDVAGGWYVEKGDGSRVALALWDNLRGHAGRVAVATTATVEAMRDGVVVSQVEAVGRRVDDLRDLMGSLRDVVGRP